jgi:hypothetical protein
MHTDKPVSAFELEPLAAPRTVDVLGGHCGGCGGCKGCGNG